MRPKVSGAWKTTSNMLTKISGTWRRVDSQYVKVGGVWRKTYSWYPLIVSTIGIGHLSLFDEEIYGFNYSDSVPALQSGTASNWYSTRGRLYKCACPVNKTPKVLEVILGGVHTDMQGRTIQYAGMTGTVTSTTVENSSGAIAETFTRLYVTLPGNCPTSGNAVLIIP